MLDSYLFAQALPSFIVSLGVILAALMLERLLVLLDLLAADSSPLSTFLGLLADLIPHYLGLAIPAAFCVSIFSSIRQLNLNNEIDALLNAGKSLFQCTRSYIISGIAVSFFCIILYGYIQPYARYDFRAAFFYASHAGWAPHIQSHMIVQPNNHTVMIVDKASQNGTQLSGIFIRQTKLNDKKQLVEQIILADKGNFYSLADHSKIMLTLYDGQNLTLNPNNNNNITDFSNASRIIQNTNKKNIFRERGSDERELTLTNLYEQIQHHTYQDIPILDIRAEFHFRLVRALSIIAIPFLAVALAITPKRRKRNLGLGIAAIILVAYDHIQQLGLTLVSHGHDNAFVALWLPFFIFLFFCFGCLFLKNNPFLLTSRNLLRHFSKSSDK
ncbi:LptF/LptG family permease [Commensalibacter melissae]|uniref:LptF/LptG family permease n=1 Tax=Commensalibacter melissae TaxID=2070537 RepID=UPI0012D884C6|nr:LptF/LptG family permease [Commensalibacter melissae]MUG81865.1 LptF/LptG family permease [Commensalibacter melissae]